MGESQGNHLLMLKNNNKATSLKLIAFPLVQCMLWKYEKLLERMPIAIFSLNDFIKG